MDYDNQKSNLPSYNLFSFISNLFYLNLTQLFKNWLNFQIMKSVTTSKSFWSQNFNRILNFLIRAITFKDY